MKVEIYVSRQDDSMSMEGDNYISSTLEKSIPLTEGMSLYHILQKEGIGLSAPCAGNGTCGACKVKQLKGKLPITKKDKIHLSEEEIREGWRLACQAYPTGDCTIYIPMEKFLAVTEYEKNKTVADVSEKYIKEKIDANSDNPLYEIAIDLGTTTIAYELFHAKTGETVKILSTTNPQRLYGADVVSRMEQSNNGRRDMLKNILRQQMRKDIKTLLGTIHTENILSIAISANTAMVHLFMGYSCEGLGKYPFTSHTLDGIVTDALMVNFLDERVPVRITEGISAYVGGDVLAGLGSQRFLFDNKINLFLDLGTNAEMALTDGMGKIYVTSAPAGPAFEAANISCGVGSIEGAISGICIENNNPRWTTIGEKEPLGFCGSGILEVVYELLKNGLMDETGLLCDAYFQTGYPIGNLKITQQDIRQIQLAKSAVFSAIQILLQKAGILPNQVEQIYLAGSFGYYLNVEKAIGIGLLPQEFTGKIKAVGNTSLQGTKELSLGKFYEEDLRNMKDVCEEIYLSNESGFQDIFMQNMNFR